MREPVYLGRRIRPLRIKSGLTQAALAQRLGISSSYLNLVENDRRPVTSTLLLALARELDVDLRTLAAGADADVLARLSELFSDPLFEDHPVMAKDLRTFVDDAPDIARAVMWLHESYVRTRTALEVLGGRLLDEQQDLGALDRARLSSEQVSDFIQRNNNYFPALERDAERLLSSGDVGAVGDELFARLSRHLQREHGVGVQIRTIGEMRGAVRRFVPGQRELHLSEALRRGSRNFQLATQIGLLECGKTLDKLTDDPKLGGAESRALCRVALASYFAGAVLMPYDAFFRAAEVGTVRRRAARTSLSCAVGASVSPAHHAAASGSGGRAVLSAARRSCRQHLKAVQRGRHSLSALQRVVLPLERARRVLAAGARTRAALAHAGRPRSARGRAHRTAARERLRRAGGTVRGGNRMRRDSCAPSRVQRRPRSWQCRARGTHRHHVPVVRADGLHRAGIPIDGRRASV